PGVWVERVYGSARSAAATATSVRKAEGFRVEAEGATLRVLYVGVESDPASEVAVQVRREGSYWLLSFDCQRCAATHHHRGCSGPAPELGFRIAHCPYWPAGYILVAK